MCGCLPPLQQDPQAKPFGESQGGCSWAGINFKSVQGSARGCQAVICGWLCCFSSSCCSLSENAKEAESQSPLENASIYSTCFPGFLLFCFFFFFCKDNASPAELAVAAKPEPAGASGWPPRIAKQRFLTCSTYAKSGIGCQEGEVTWKEFVCCRHDKTEHPNQPGSGAGPVQLVGREMESESCVWLQESPSLGCSFLSSSYSRSPHRACASQKMGLKTRSGEGLLLLSHCQVTQLCVTTDKP